jgi:hypothetical protein
MTIITIFVKSGTFSSLKSLCDILRKTVPDFTHQRGAYMLLEYIAIAVMIALPP